MLLLNPDANEIIGIDRDDNCDGEQHEGESMPPYDGAIFLDPDIIMDTDPTTLQSISYTGQGS